MQTKTLADLVKVPKAAVIVVDVQNDFCEAEGSLGKAGAPTAAAKAMIARRIIRHLPPAMP